MVDSDKISGNIYMIVNQVNDKVYIGQTTQPVEVRFKQHLKLAKSNQSQAIYKAIKKYGADSFSYVVLKSDICTLDELDLWEQRYISEYNSVVPNGYNLCPGGQQWRRRPALSDDEQCEICDLYLTGLSARCIGERYHVNHKTILNVLHNRGVPVRDRASNLPDRSSIITHTLLCEMYCSKGMSIKEISETTHISERSIRRAINRYNLREYKSGLIS